jgi:hypothetical protein
MFEVQWITLEYDWQHGQQEQVFRKNQFGDFEEALSDFRLKKDDIDVEQVRIISVLDEFSR